LRSLSFFSLSLLFLITSVIHALSLSADAKVLYSASQDSSLKIYDLAQKRQLRSTNVCDLALSSCELAPNGRTVVVGSWDNNIYTYSVDYGSVLDTIGGHDDAVSCLCLRGTVLASGSWDATVRLWQFKSDGSLSRVPLAVFIEHDTAVHAVTLDARAELLASGTADGTVAVFDVRARSLLRTMPLHSSTVSELQFTPDSTRLLSCSHDGLLRLHEAQSGVEIFKTQIETELT
jgi:factor associated with neutral sphingomyelinase activation